MDISIVIKFEGKRKLETQCCRDVLCQKSDYFKAMFQSKMRESNSDCIEIEFKEPKKMKQVLEYLHGGNLAINTSNVAVLTELACMLQIKELKDLCSSSLLLDLNKDNALRTLTLADLFCLNSVYNRARNVLWWNLYQLSRNGRGARELLRDLITQEKDIDMSHVHAILENDITKFESGYDTCLLCFDKDLNLPVCTTEDLLHENQEFTCDSIIDVTCETRLSHSGYYGVCTQGCYIYVSGGQPEIGGRQWYQSIWRLDLLMRKWEEIAPMEKPRRSHGFCALGDCLFLVGGYGKYRVRLRTVEEYDVSTGEWKQRADVPDTGMASSITIARTMLEQETVFVFSGDIFSMKPKTENYWTKIDIAFPSCSVNSSLQNISDVTDFTCGRNNIYFVCATSSCILSFSTKTNSATWIHVFGDDDPSKEYLGNVVMVKDRITRVYRSIPKCGDDSRTNQYFVQWFDPVTSENGQHQVLNQDIAFEFRHMLTVPVFPNFRNVHVESN